MVVSLTNLPSRRKLALVIGNGRYSHSSNAKNNAKNYVQDLSAALEKIEFSVTQHIDVDDNMMNRIEEFVKTINDGDLVLFYFYGHVYPTDEGNYFIPVNDSKLESEVDIKEQCTSVNSALSRLVTRNPSYATIFILDCTSSYKLQGMQRGKNLLKMKKRAGAFIHFSHFNGEGASGVWRNGSSSVFIRSLLKNIIKENITVGVLFQQIKQAVERESHHQQNPLSIDGLEKAKRFYLNEVIYDDTLEKERKAQMDVINDINQKIRKLKYESECLGLKGPHNWGAYDAAISCRLGEIKALIHSLTIKRSDAIGIIYRKPNR